VRGLAKKGFEVAFLVELLLKGLFFVAGQPKDDGVHFGFDAPFSIRFLDVKRIDVRKQHFEYSCVVAVVHVEQFYF
jgi:hypothetical protein